MANQRGSMENSGKLMSSNLIILQLVAVVQGRSDPIILYTNQLYNSESQNRCLRHQYVPETTGNFIFTKRTKTHYLQFQEWQKINF